MHTGSFVLAEEIWCKFSFTGIRLLLAFKIKSSIDRPTILAVVLIVILFVLGIGLGSLARTLKYSPLSLPALLLVPSQSVRPRPVCPNIQ